MKMNDMSKLYFAQEKCYEKNKEKLNKLPRNHYHYEGVKEKPNQQYKHNKEKLQLVTQVRYRVLPDEEK